MKAQDQARSLSELLSAASSLDCFGAGLPEGDAPFVELRSSRTALPISAICLSAKAIWRRLLGFSTSSGRLLLSALIVASLSIGAGIVGAPASVADPGGQSTSTVGPPLDPAPVHVAPDALADGNDADQLRPPDEVACRQFSDALDVAATHYSDFADVTSGDSWTYRDPAVSDANATGRTALRQAAVSVAQASATPGLLLEVSAALRQWSLRAGKLILVMGLRGDDDRTNSAAAALNDETYAVQMACTNAGITG